MSEVDDVKFLRGYIRAWAALTIIGAFVLGIAFIFIGTLHEVPSSARNILQAVGSSVIASLILYVLISILIDPKRQAAQARQAINYGIQMANRQFAERFEVALPTEVFEGSSIPKPPFRDAFVDLITSSTRYDFRGESGSFTAYRLARCCDHPEIRRLDQIRLCVLSPLSPRTDGAYARENRRQDSRTYKEAKAIEKDMNLREEIFVTLWTLYQIRQKVAASVYFHSDLPFFRCELFDHGMFLTYYLDRRIYPNYPETLQFSAATRPYRAYSTALALTRTFAPQMVMFGDVGPGADLINTDDKFFALLRSLGCDLTSEELDNRQKDRFRRFDQGLREAGLSMTDLF
jgi:hypothetical protein